MKPHMKSIDKQIILYNRRINIYLIVLSLEDVNILKIVKVKEIPCNRINLIRQHSILEVLLKIVPSCGQ